MNPWRICSLASLAVLSFFFGAEMSLTAAEQASTEFAEGTLTSPMGDTAPAAPVKHCTLVDSNGPLEGGEITTYGCRDDEMCVCDHPAGYSCGGICRPLNKGRDSGRLRAE